MHSPSSPTPLSSSPLPSPPPSSSLPSSPSLPAPSPSPPLLPIEICSSPKINTPNPTPGPSSRVPLARKVKDILPPDVYKDVKQEIKREKGQSSRSRGKRAPATREKDQSCRVIQTCTSYAGYTQGDCVLLRPAQEDWVHYVNKEFVDYLKNRHSTQYLHQKGNKNWIGRIVQFLQENDGEWVAEVQYFWYPENTFLYFNDGLHPKLLFFVEDKLRHPVSEIISKCKVKHKNDISAFDEWIKVTYHYFYEHIYDPTERSYVTPPEYLVPSLELDKKSKVLELFAGAGGMAEGFKLGGLLPTWAVELNEDAARTLREFHKKTIVYQEDVNNFIRKICYIHGIKFERSWTLLSDVDGVKNTKMGDMGNKDELEKGCYLVEKIIKKRWNKGRVEYLLKWKDFPDSQNTWQLATEISREVVEEYEQEVQLQKILQEKIKRGKGREEEIESSEDEENSEGEEDKEAEEEEEDNRDDEEEEEEEEGEEGEEEEEGEEGGDEEEKIEKEEIERGIKRRLRSVIAQNKKRSKEAIDLTQSSDEEEREKRETNVVIEKKEKREKEKKNKKNKKNETEKRKRKETKKKERKKTKKEKGKEKEKEKERDRDRDIIISGKRLRWGKKYYCVKRGEDTAGKWESEDTVPVEAIAHFEKLHESMAKKEEEYEVKCVRDMQIDIEGNVQFLIEWKGYPESDNWWLDAEEVPEKLINEYIARERQTTPIPGKLNVLLGGTPCKGFSHINRHRDSIHPLKNNNNQLVLSYLDSVDLWRPDMCVVENVVGILSLADGFIIKQIFHAFILMGYQVSLHILNAAMYGAPQSRLRVIIFAAKNGLHLPKAPPSTHDGEFRDTITNEFQVNIVYPDPKGYWFNSPDATPHYLPLRTVRQAISDLPDIPTGETSTCEGYKKGSPFNSYQQSMRRHDKNTVHNHHCRTLGADAKIKLAETPRDGPLDSNGNVNYTYPNQEPQHKLIKRYPNGKCSCRSRWNKPYSTIVTTPSPQMQCMVHPHVDRYQTVRELARGQGFPDHCVFYGSVTEQYRMVGNAVPVQLAAAVGSSVNNALRLSTKPGLKDSKKKYEFCQPCVVVVDWVDKGWEKRNGKWVKINQVAAGMGVKEKQVEDSEKNKKADTDEFIWEEDMEESKNEKEKNVAEVEEYVMKDEDAEDKIQTSVYGGMIDDDDVVADSDDDWSSMYLNYTCE